MRRRNTARSLLALAEALAAAAAGAAGAAAAAAAADAGVPSTLAPVDLLMALLGAACSVILEATRRQRTRMTAPRDETSEKQRETVAAGNSETRSLPSIHRGRAT